MLSSKSCTAATSGSPAFCGEPRRRGRSAVCRESSASSASGASPSGLTFAYMETLHLDGRSVENFQRSQRGSRRWRTDSSTTWCARASLIKTTLKAKNGGRKRRRCRTTRGRPAFGTISPMPSLRGRSRSGAESSKPLSKTKRNEVSIGEKASSGRSIRRPRGRARCFKMPRNAVLDQFVRMSRVKAVRDGHAEYSPLHPPDPTVVPAPSYVPLQLKSWR